MKETTSVCLKVLPGIISLDTLKESCEKSFPSRLDSKLTVVRVEYNKNLVEKWYRCTILLSHRECVADIDFD